jgi:hypothetical protein
MRVKQFAEAQRYRLRGFEPGAPTKSWVGLSHFLPGAGAGPDASPLEKVYVVLARQLTISAGGDLVTLGPLDSCFIPGGETREVKDPGNDVATMIVVMPYPEGTQ